MALESQRGGASTFDKCGLTFWSGGGRIAATARALRIQRPAGRYHVTARGNERRAIYRQESDRAHFLEFLGELSERFGLRVHAYVLMDNHFHLLVETPEANLSRPMQWSNVSYSMCFNRRHERLGRMFQGRFKSVLGKDEAGWFYQG
ncbi:MAG: transposase [Verrucomicrobiota bacterium]